MAKSELYANTVLDDLFGSGSPATLYIELLTALANPDGTGGTEVTGGSYARAAVTNNNTNFPAASGGEKSNANAITFATASADWGTIQGVRIRSASSGGGGDIYYHGALDTPRTVNNGDTFSFAATQLVIQES